ncbi:MAG: hypothetical protein ACYC6L_02715 [Anaerolineae bacterium]
MAGKRSIGWLFYWLLVAFIQWLGANIVSLALAQFVPANIATLNGLLLALGLTWLADCAVIWGAGWAALKIRQVQPPLRLPLRLALVAAAALLVLAGPLIVYLLPGNLDGALLFYQEVPVTAAAALLGILVFQLPGWFGQRQA